MVINVASIEISILCIVILLMILATYKGNFQQKPQSGLFKLVIYCFVVFSVVDACKRQFNSYIKFILS